VTALADALTAAGHTPADMPAHRRVLLPPDPQLSMHYWSHGCPTPGCITWVPNHRRGCANHPEETT
jgi:hypothetical protein